MDIAASTLYNTDYYKSSTHTSELENKLKGEDFTNADSEKLLDVCKEFEAYFVEQLFKGMEKMIPEGDEKKENNEVEMFGDMMYQEMAKSATKRQDFGIAKQLYEQMKRNYGIE